MNEDSKFIRPPETSGRRTFLSAIAAVTMAGAEPAPIPIIDTHFHLYDQTRPQGAPFPFTPNHPPFLPRNFRETAIPLGIVGGIEVEASPWLEDNLWVLMMIESEPMIVGTIGDLDPVKPDFPEYLERFHRNKLFLGIRYGNVWKQHDLVTAVRNPGFIGNMRIFAQTGLTLEVANPRFDLFEATLRLTDKVPDLRVVLGHLQALALPTDPGVFKSYSNNLAELRRRKAYAKVSGLYRPRSAPQAPFDSSAYKPVMDFIHDIFGEDYLVYAGRNKQALDILMAYFLAKGRPAAEKFFWKNSIPAFRWVRRDPKQPRLDL
ncbi:MAG: amidohydrolase family protein [Bryobacterales bacterium]|nr:amidohydrolase family protein [Bryobacterales bacterium]